MDDLVLRISGITKSFGPIQALKGVDFELKPGEIHALAGENGAGKSTLVNTINGILSPDSGTIYWEGEPVTIGSPTEAQKLGIGLVHQEIALCPDISVTENILMSQTNLSRKFFVDYPALEAQARAVLRKLTDIDPKTCAGILSISSQQLVEIAKALTLDCKVLILDEPTAALTEKEAQLLFGIMRRLADQGIGIVYISHRMVEIFDNCDRVTVFRDGSFVSTMQVSEISPSDVVNAMVGRAIDELYPEKQSDEETGREEILSVRNFSDATRFRDVSFDLKHGEVLGIAGLIGAGRSEIVKGICRIEGDVTGEVRLNGETLDLRDYGDSIDAGMVYLSEDRKRSGLFLDMSIAENISALDLSRIARRGGRIDVRKERERARELGQRLGLKYSRLSDPVSSLSGGNQQKVAIAKMLSVEPKLIFLDEPTRGVDVGAKAEIHKILRDLASSGVGIVVISSELPELIGLCDRVIVIREGRISGEVSGDDMTEEAIMNLASVLEYETTAE
jgi:ribose transport system ATP-binding protein